MNQLNQLKVTDLNHSNYFSKEMMIKYMSSSQFKVFSDCEERGLAELSGQYDGSKECFQEGHYFEACLSNTKDLFLAKNPNMVSSKGTTKGELKANYKKIEESIEAFKRQKTFMDTISKCEQQVILTGVINGIKYKGCIDFLDMQTLNSYDTKCLKDLKKVWSDEEHKYIKWYFGHGYHYQAAIYRELIYQNFGAMGTVNLLVSTKEKIPDVAALTFSNIIMDNAMGIIEEFSPRFNALKLGLPDVTPTACGICDYCKQTKQVNDFEVIYDYE